MAISFVLTLLVTCSSRALGIKLPSFDAFIAEHARAYQQGSAEYEQRRRLFEERSASYDRHNRNPQRLWNAAVNGLTDWTEEELRSLRGWRGVVVADERGALRGASKRSVGRHELDLKQKHHALPPSKSWAHLKALQTPRNQGACGSCWAYATAVAMEGCYERAFGAHRRFNPTQLVECAPNPHRCGGDGGCGGSTAEMAMMYVADHGLDDRVTCSAGHSSLLERSLGDADWQLFLQPGVHQVPTESPAHGLGLRAWQRLPQNEAEPLMQALVDWGPVAVSLSADFWGGYSDGIFTGCSANATIDHAVVMIGYGADRDTTTNFWHIQNSWGQYWGESGRIRIIRRDTDNVDCGTDFHPEQGTGCEGGPATVTVCGECGILYDSVVPHFSKV